MQHSPKSPCGRQGELFATHDMTWLMLSDEQQIQAIELLSRLLLRSLTTEPHCQTQIETPETNNE